MGLAFDPIAGAEAAAHMTVSLLLNPQRAARLVYFSSKDTGLLGLNEMIDRLLDRTWKAPAMTGIKAELNRAVSFIVLDHLLSLATSRSSSAQVKAITHLELKELQGYLKKNRSADPGQKAAQELAIDLIENYIGNPAREYRVRRISPPPGSPIGSCGYSGY